MDQRVLNPCTETNVVLEGPCICEVQQQSGCGRQYVCLYKLDGTRVCSNYQCLLDKLEPELCICDGYPAPGGKVSVCHAGTLCVEDYLPCFEPCSIGAESSTQCACKLGGSTFGPCKMPQRCVYSSQQDQSSAVCVSECKYGTDPGKDGCFCQSGAASYLYCGSGQYCLLKDDGSGFSQCYKSCADTLGLEKCVCQESTGIALCDNAYLCLDAPSKRCMTPCRLTSAGPLVDVQDCACETASGEFEMCPIGGFCMLDVVGGSRGRCYALQCTPGQTNEQCPCLTNAESVYLCSVGYMCLEIEAGVSECLAICPLGEATDNLCYCGVGTEPELCGGTSACFADESAKLTCLDVCIAGEQIYERDCLCKALNATVTLCKANDVCSAAGDVLLVCHEGCDGCFQSASLYHCEGCATGFRMAGEGTCSPCADVCTVCASGATECAECGYTEEARLSCKKDSWNVWMIAGIAAGAAVVVIAIGVAVVLYCKRRNRSRSVVKQINNPETEQPKVKREVNSAKEDIRAAVP